MKVNNTQQQLIEQGASLDEIQGITHGTHAQSNSVLLSVTQILQIVTTGLMRLRDINNELCRLIRICTTFTEEMRATMSKIMDLFRNLQTILQRIDRNLPARPYLPTLQLTTALGETIALPYQLCQQWPTFKELVRLVFKGKPGASRVEMERYLIMNTRGGRMLDESSWRHAVREDDHLSMSIVIGEVLTRPTICPFPACEALIEGVKLERGGFTCRECNQWSKCKPLQQSMLFASAYQIRDIINSMPSNNGVHLIYSQFVEYEQDTDLFKNIHARFMPHQDGKATFDHALQYVNRVKEMFSIRPDIYQDFLTALQEYQNRTIDLFKLFEQILFCMTRTPELILGLEWHLPMLDGFPI